ncbi:ParA family protein [Clostridium sp. LBM24168]
MVVTLSIFNNKGGVGKTTYMYHIAHLLCKKDIKVLMVDCDSQCNLTSYTLDDASILRSWGEKGNSIYRILEPVEKGLGDIRQRSPEKVKDNLYIVPGDLYLTNYEDKLGDSWIKAKGGSESDIRIQSAVYRYIQWAAEKIKADIIMIDLGPNLGSLNRTVLGGSDYFIIPASPDLFSIRGTENLGNKLILWEKEWEQCNRENKSGLIIPKGKPSFLGYVMQQHNIRSNNQGMTQGWQIFGNKLEEAIQKNIVNKLQPLGQTSQYGKDSFNLGKIPNLHSLIPYSLNARKPVFDCGSHDGLKGAHITTAKDSVKYFEPMVKKIMNII